MNDAELPLEVREFISSSVPSTDALEILMFLVRQPGSSWDPAELARAMQPAVVADATIRESLAHFRAQGVVVESAPGRFEYFPASAAIGRAVAGLTTAYNERPVTLIRTVYAIADAKKIQAFADAFKFKKDE